MVVVLVAVEDAVAVGVRVVRVGSEEAFLDVVEPVVVLVERRRRPADAPGVRGDAERQQREDREQSDEEDAAWGTHGGVACS